MQFQHTDDENKNEKKKLLDELSELISKLNPQGVVQDSRGKYITARIIKDKELNFQFVIRFMPA